MKYADLLPQPRDIERREGVCRLDRSHVPEHADALLIRIGDAPPATAPAHGEGYTLAIAPGGATIAGHDLAGAFYGLQTLHLLLQDDGPLPCGVIRDWPAIRRRGIHIDLKGYQPKFSRLLEMVRLLARYKINTILLELEDKFAFESAPEVGVDGAFTAGQMRELGDLCLQLHIQLIPKLQCLGHVDYLLKHDRYRPLREAGHPYQFCPNAPGMFELWRSMAAELMACFPGHHYFHVGADETKHLGECDVCRPRGKARTYVDHVGRCLDFVTAAGRKPIMWDDILRNLHGTLSPDELEQTWALGAKCTLMYWAYGYNGRDNAFPFLPDYLSRGLDVWGASGYSGCGEGWFQNVPPLRHRAMNIAAWTKAALDHHLPGVMCTSWTRIVSFYPPDEIPEACWFNILYAADSTWSGRERPLPEHGRVVAQSLFEAILPQHVEFLLDLDHRLLPPSDAQVSRHADRFALLAAAMAVTDHEHQRQHGWLNLYEILHAHHGLLGHQATDYAVALFRERLDAFRRSLQERSADLKAALERFYEASTVEEVLRSRFGRDQQLVDEVQSLIDRTRLS